MDHLIQNSGAQAQTRLNYIDGLRALAVVAVIVFHSGIGILPGGFAGVDVFFVISGYVITARIVPALIAGRFRLFSFWAARARRIVPALLLLLLFTLPVCYLLLSPADTEPFATGIGASVLMLSNWWMAGADDYFSPALGTVPLMHTWSLAVEWQFYLFFPVLVGLAYRFRGRTAVGVALLVTAVLSFAVALLTGQPGNMSNFYSPVSRSWEFALGALAFVGLDRLRLPGSTAILALLMLASSFALLSGDLATPGLTTLFPVVATSLLILAAPRARFVRGLLEHPMALHLGRISYSLYLFHQPALFVARQVVPDENWPVLWALLAAWPMAYLSWRYVEEPFRKPAEGARRMRRRLGLLSLAMGIVAAGFVLWWDGGAPWRFGPEIQLLDRTSRDVAPKNACVIRTAIKAIDPACRFPGPAGKIDVMLLGDSHALAISGALQESLAQDGLGFQYLANPGCLPIIGLRHALGRDCTPAVESMLDAARAADVKVLVVVGRFTAALTGTGYDNGEGGIEEGNKAVYPVNAPAGLSERERQAQVVAAFRSGLSDDLKSFKVVLLDPIPEAGWRVPNIAMRRFLATGSREDVTTSLPRYLQRHAAILDLFDSLSSPNLFRVRTRDAFCDPATGRCRNTHNLTAYYFDDDHLTNAGARELVPLIARAVADALAAQ